MSSEYTYTFVQLGISTHGNAVNGVLYEPAAPGEKSRIAILVMHSDSDYLTFSMGREMAKRGYRVLCANVSDRRINMDIKILEAKMAVAYLKGLTDVNTVVLMGHSGGATLMSAYQAIAENGVQIFQGDEKLTKASDELIDLPAADGVMMLDANWGNGAMALFSLDPAVADEESGRVLDPMLDLFNPENGFTPEGSDYGEAFLQRYFTGQRFRSNRLIETALARVATIDSGYGNYVDDEPFNIPSMANGADNNKLYPQDTKLFAHTRHEWPLLHGDNSATIEIVHSLRRPQNSTSFTDNMDEGALITTAKNFLTNSAVQTTEDYRIGEDGVVGIDWSSSYNCGPGNIQYISVPTLAMGMTAGWEYLAAEIIYENSASSDKTIAFVEGADHKFNTATELEEYPGQFGDTMKMTYDYVDTWLSQEGRFTI